MENFENKNLNTKQNTQKTNLRDYDKEPIVIKDYNPMFIPLTLCMYVIFSFFAAFFDPFNSGYDGRNLLVLMITIGSPAIYFYRRYKKKQYEIILDNKEIKYIVSDKIFNSIKLNEITQIYKTFNDIVTPKQLVKKEQFWMRVLYILNIFVILAMIIVRFIYNYFKFKKIAIFSSLIVYDKNGNFINIFPISDYELNLIRNYFLEMVSIDVLKANTKAFLFYHTIYFGEFEPEKNRYNDNYLSR